jgi:hypothetical protein
LGKVFGPYEGFVFYDFFLVFFENFVHFLHINFQVLLKIVFLNFATEDVDVRIIFFLEKDYFLFDLLTNFYQILMLCKLFLNSSFSYFCNKFIKKGVYFFNYSLSFEIEWFYVSPFRILNIAQCFPSLQSFLKHCWNFLLQLCRFGHNLFDIFKLSFHIFGMIFSVVRNACVA